MLYLVPTPIGNLEDISYRAVRILKEVDYILCEDTRTTKKLLDAYEILTPCKSFHAHNEHSRLASVINDLEAGQRIALVSDAGTPGISDPGFLLVREAATKRLDYTVLPGANAVVPALVGSGLPCERFFFEGFLPHKKGRATRIKTIAEQSITTVLFESSHRLVRCLEELAAACGPDRKSCVAREISKLHEEFRKGTLNELLVHYKQLPNVKGEIVVVLEGMKN